MVVCNGIFSRHTSLMIGETSSGPFGISRGGTRTCVFRISSYAFKAVGVITLYNFLAPFWFRVRSNNHTNKRSLPLLLSQGHAEWTIKIKQTKAADCAAAAAIKYLGATLAGQHSKLQVIIWSMFLVF